MDIYQSNKYTTLYFSIIESAVVSNRKRNKTQIYENHHIIPKKLGGSNCDSNKVLLTPKEHYICHRLLPKMVKTKYHYEKMIYALWCLVNGNGRSIRHSPCGAVYEQIKTELVKTKSQAMQGSKNHFYGKNHSEKTKHNFSVNNPAKREEVKAKMRGPRLGFMPHNHFTGWSDEVKQKLSKANIGKKLSEETKQKMLAYKVNLVWVKHPTHKSKHIPIEQLNDFLAGGWERGRGPVPRKSW